MTDQEAIKWIDGRVLELSCLSDITSTAKGLQRIAEEYDALRQARAAIEKRIPMVPVRIIIHKDEIWRKEEYRCAVCMEPLFNVEAVVHPICGWERHANGSHSPFCPTCGQALKWGDRE